MFNGKRFGVSLLRVAPASDDAEKKDAQLARSEVSAEATTQSDLIALIEKHGGRVFGIIAKKTDFVVCSNAAFAAATQKVRKAFKLGVRCVHEGFIEDSIAAGELQDVAHYTALLGSPPQKAIKAAENKRRKASEGPDSAASNAQRKQNTKKARLQKEIDTLVFDKASAVCTCICHEEGDTSHCTWCGGSRPYEWKGALAPTTEVTEEGGVLDTVDGGSVEADSTKRTRKKQKKKRKKASS